MFNTIPAVPFTPPYYRAADVKVTLYYASDAPKQEAYDEAHQQLVKRLKRHKAEEKLAGLQKSLDEFTAMDPPEGKQAEHDKQIEDVGAGVEDFQRLIGSEYGDLAPCAPDGELEERAKLLGILAVKVRVGDEEHAWPDTLENQMALLRSLPPAAVSEIIDGLFYEAYDQEAPGKS
jgi:hypothetical protein